MRLQKQLKDLKWQLKMAIVKPVDAQSCNLPNDSELSAIQVPTAVASLEDFSLASQNSSFNRLLELQVSARRESVERSLAGSDKSNSVKEKAAVSSGLMSQEVGKTSSERNSCRRRLAPDRIASLKDLVSSCSREGNVNRKQSMIGKEVAIKEEAENKGEDESKDEKEKTSDSLASMNHLVGVVPSKTSNVRPRLGRDSIASLNNLVSSCSRPPAPFQGRKVKKTQQPRREEKRSVEGTNH